MNPNQVMGPQNREQKRRAKKSINHNVYTKKYHSKEARDAAWKNFMGPEHWAYAQKQLKALAKKLKLDKQLAKTAVPA